MGLACELLFLMAMSSFDSIYKKMASSLEPGEAGKFRETHTLGARHVSPLVAHELNNILTIIQGYADRLLNRHGENEALQPHLKLISEAAKRAATIVQEATPSSLPANRKSAPASLVNA